MLSPKRTKFRKQQKGKNRGVAWTAAPTCRFGDFALQALEPACVTCAPDRGRLVWRFSAT